MIRQYSKKQIERYRRQKYINLLNKCTRQLYRFFKDEKSQLQEYQKRFQTLKKELEAFNDVIISSDHIKRIKEYIENLYQETVLNKDFNQEKFDKIKALQASNLNRLQRMKNSLKYKKNKYNSFE